ncbi:HNH endonuclease [Phenylobacterium sp. LjRoot164]|uniref:HNH endonuclease n=1 Tax=unclassified Phenylobacterium TaxID=2640670 RepID=UPI003ECFD382
MFHIRSGPGGIGRASFGAMKKGEPYSPRLVRIEGDIAYVPLTKGYEAIIDASDASLVSDRSWYAQESRTGVYAARSQTIEGRQKCVLMHRVLLAAPDEMEVDHCDGDGLNNRRANLRLATRLQNQGNRPANRSNRLGVKGVRAHQGRYMAEITVSGRSTFLGSFDTIEEASAAYAQAANTRFGEFARS